MKRTAPFQPDEAGRILDSTGMFLASQMPSVHIGAAVSYGAAAKTLYDRYIASCTSKDAAVKANLHFSLAKWRLGKIVYDFDTVFFRELRRTKDTQLQLAVLRRLPYFSFYIHCPERGSVGFVVYVEPHDNGTCLLSSIQLFNGGGRLSFRSFSLWLLDGESVTDAMRRVVQKMRVPDGGQAAYGDFSSYADGVEVQNYAYMAKSSLLAAYYLASRNAEVRPVRRPDTLDVVHSQHARNDREPMQVRIFRVGHQVGETLREVSVASCGRKPWQGGTKRPHIRAAHWHHYRTGAGRARVEVRWLLPILVNCVDSG